MKILLSTPVFKPMVGGMETIAENLAKHFSRKGHEVTVVTPIESDQEDEEAYRVVRNPGLGQKIELLREADIVYSKGASLYMAPLAWMLGKKFLWTHAGYQVSCIDGLGWHQRGPAPMNPWDSFNYHRKKESFSKALYGLFKVSLLQLVARHYVSANIAISDWMVKRQPLPRQVRIYNPFPIEAFRQVVELDEPPVYDFFFLGRLVSEKGVETLIRAFAILQNEISQPIRLCLIGSGPERPLLEALSSELGVQDTIDFVGRQVGEDLFKMIARGKIAVVPSAWEEPFGGVATELMAAGKNIIVSKNGALAELIPDTPKMVFENRNPESLAACMKQLWEDKPLQETQKIEIQKKLRQFDESRLVEDYLALFQSVLAGDLPAPYQTS